MNWDWYVSRIETDNYSTTETGIGMSVTDNWTVPTTSMRTKLASGPRKLGNNIKTWIVTGCESLSGYRTGYGTGTELYLGWEIIDLELEWLELALEQDMELELDL